MLSGLPCRTQEGLWSKKKVPGGPGREGVRLMTREREPHFEGAMKYSDRHLAGLSARPPDRVDQRVELIGAGSLGNGTGPSFG